MPELPEVETVCRGIAPHIIGQTITHVECMRRDLRIPVPDQLEETITERAISHVTRRAKYIQIHLANQPYIILIHLGMSGRLVLVENNQDVPLKKHDHVVFNLSNNMKMMFHDPRRFGLVTLLRLEEEKTHPLLSHLGMEPLEKTFDGAYLYRALKHKNSSIKLALMDNRIAVGIGNIYACESLFRARLHPERPASSISKQSYSELASHIQAVLNEAISSGGSTLRDYVRSSGDSGYFQHHFAVYGRENKSCTDCTNLIQRIKQSGRSTFYCPTCQTKDDS